MNSDIDTASAVAPPSNSATEELRKEVDAALRRRARLPLHQVAALGGTLVAVVAGLVWQAHSIISPIEANIAQLQWQVSDLRSNSKPPSPEFSLRRWNIALKNGQLSDERQSTADLSEVAFKLKENADLIALLVGHTNNDKPMDEALALGNTWATGFAMQLHSLGVEPARTIVRSMAFQRPLFLPNDPKNNRVEIVLVNLKSLLMPGDI